MTIREFISNNTIFDLNEICIDTLDSERESLYLFQGSLNLDAALYYFDREVISFYHSFKYKRTVFVIK